MESLKHYCLIAVLLINSTFIHGQNLSEFKTLLAECGMKFDNPSGFAESEIVENADMNYEYALKYPNKDFIVRYSVRPITYKVYANAEVKNELEGQKGFRNSQYEIIFKTVMLNLTGGIEYKYTVFDTDAVKAEFNADWGVTTFVDLNPNGEFGKGYKYCMIVSIHKRDIADAYYFYLSNTKDKFMDNVDPLFHSLKFE
jgi:hypothetical protein